MVIFVTGFHTAGTRSAGRYFAELHGFEYVQEQEIKQDLANALKLRDGTSLQCPQMAHESIELSRRGQVYWMTRDHEALVKSMWGMRTGHVIFEMMAGFKRVLPDDPVWDTVQYDGSEDVFYGYPGYFALFVKIKNYLLNKYYLPYVKVLQAEEMPYWDKHKPKVHVLSQKQTELMNWHFDYWEEIRKELE